MSNSNDLLTVREVARILRTSNKAIYAMHARGQIKGAIKIGKRLLFKEAALFSWIDSFDQSAKGVRNERSN
jgi:excisionase family DNA binding protein